MEQQLVEELLVEQGQMRETMRYGEDDVDIGNG